MSQLDELISDLFGWIHPPGNAFRPSTHRVDALLVEAQLHSEHWKISSDVEANGTASVRLYRDGLWISKSERSYMRALVQATIQAKKFERRIQLITGIEPGRVIRLVMENNQVFIGAIISRFERGPALGPIIWIKPLVIPEDYKPKNPSSDRIGIDKDSEVASLTVVFAPLVPALDQLYAEDGVARPYRFLLDPTPFATPEPAALPVNY